MRASVFAVSDWVVKRPTFAVGPVDFELSAGSILTVMGPSGVGKTSLLLTWLGYGALGLEATGLRTQHGSLLSSRAIPSNALYIPQHLPFNPNWELHSYLSKLRWASGTALQSDRSTYGERVRAVLRELGLEHRARATVAELSGGEIQRAALAQMLLVEPEILVADEFVSSLDPGLAVALLDRCKHDVQKRGAVAVFALHHVHSALRVSDSILLIWPRHVAAAPWRLDATCPGWDGDLLHSALCLSQWCTEIRSDHARVLVRFLENLFVQAGAIDELLSSTEGTGLALHVGGVVALEDPGEFAPDYHHANSLAMVPIRRVADGRIWLGVRILRGSRRFSIVAPMAGGNA